MLQDFMQKKLVFTGENHQLNFKKSS